MFNKAILMGRLTRDPELKTTPSGVSVCTFSIAVDRRFQTKGEEKKTDFFNIVAWRQTGEFVSRYFKKGSMIMVEGELQTRQYTNKNGVNVTVTEVNAEQVSFTGEKATGQTVPQEMPPEPSEPDYSQAEDSDDYPF